MALDPLARSLPMLHLSRCKIHHIRTPDFLSIIGPARSQVRKSSRSWVPSWLCWASMVSHCKDPSSAVMVHPCSSWLSYSAIFRTPLTFLIPKLCSPSLVPLTENLSVPHICFQTYIRLFQKCYPRLSSLSLLLHLPWLMFMWVTIFSPQVLGLMGLS